MKKTIITFLLCAAALLVTVSCGKSENGMMFANTAMGNFEALWHIMDEHYCFFDFKKQELGVDWNEVHDRYRAAISDNMTQMALFEVLANMLSELQDGHVNLYGTYDVGRNWHWKTDYPSNYSKELRDIYLGDDSKMAGLMEYTVLEDNIGYIVIESFQSSVSDSRLDAVLHYLSLCNGLIIDIRDNGGGSVSSAETLAARFTNEKILVGYTCYKDGPGHNDFSELIPTYISPAKNNMRWQKPVALIVNRGCFSAANDFAVMMKEMPEVRLFGDRTGGGGGMPISSELPNGWSVRFSSAPSFDARGEHVEGGIDPHQQVSLTDSDKARGVDTLIEAAREWINGMLVNP